MVKSFFSSLPATEVWVPSQTFLHIVLVIGALLMAGVALAVFSFYEDYYWGDRKFRDELRLHPSQRENKGVISRKV